MEDFYNEDFDFYDDMIEVDDFLGNLITNFCKSETKVFEDRIIQFNESNPDFKNMIYIDNENVTDIYGNNIHKSTSSLRYTDYEAWEVWNKFYND